MDALQPVVLVPLDGSRESEAALKMARAVARSRGARIRLLRVMPPAEPVVDGADRVIAYVDQEAARLTNEATDYLHALRARIGRFEVEEVVRFGTPAAEIVAESRARDVTFVVMAAHPRTWLRWLLRRSVTRRVERAARVPVLRTPYAAAA
jgi:nucleotide-binding universal stress UspA family protein